MDLVLPHHTSFFFAVGARSVSIAQLNAELRRRLPLAEDVEYGVSTRGVTAEFFVVFRALFDVLVKPTAGGRTSRFPWTLPPAHRAVLFWWSRSVPQLELINEIHTTPPPPRRVDCKLEVEVWPPGPPLGHWEGCVDILFPLCATTTPCQCSDDTGGR